MHGSSLCGLCKWSPVGLGRVQPGKPHISKKVLKLKLLFFFFWLCFETESVQPRLIAELEILLPQPGITGHVPPHPVPNSTLLRSPNSESFHIL